MSLCLFMSELWPDQPTLRGTMMSLAHNAKRCERMNEYFDQVIAELLTLLNNSQKEVA